MQWQQPISHLHRYGHTRISSDDFHIKVIINSYKALVNGQPAAAGVTQVALDAYIYEV